MPYFAELEKAIIARYAQLLTPARMEERPHLIDFAMMKEVQDIVHSSPSTIVTADTFTTLIPDLGARWIAEREEELKDILSKQLGCIPEGVDPFKLAMGFFFCTEGECHHSILRYPEILGHRCTRKTYASDDENGLEIAPYAFAAAQHQGRVMARAAWERYSRIGEFTPFNSECIVKNEKATEKAVRAMRAILTAMGLDPVRATIEELQNCATRIRCTTCVRKGVGNVKLAYGWEAAVSAPSPHPRVVLTRFSSFTIPSK